MIPNPWVILGIAAVWLASLLGVGFWQNHVGHVGEREAHQAEQIAELKAANGQLAQANTRIHELEESARAQEAQHAAQLATVGENYEHELQAAEGRRRNDVAAARAGALKLRVPNACPEPDDRGGGEAATTVAAAGQRHDATTAELPGSVTADLLELVDDADQVVQQLTACQAVVAADRQAKP